MTRHAKAFNIKTYSYEVLYWACVFGAIIALDMFQITVCAEFNPKWSL